MKTKLPIGLLLAAAFNVAHAGHSVSASPPPPPRSPEISEPLPFLPRGRTILLDLLPGITGRKRQRAENAGVPSGIEWG